MFFCTRPPSHEKGSTLEGKRGNLANHIFETPVERPEVGIQEQKTVELLPLGGCLTGFQPFKLNEIKQMPWCRSRPDWRRGLHDTKDPPQCNCRHVLAEKTSQKKGKTNILGRMTFTWCHLQILTSAGLSFSWKLVVFNVPWPDPAAKTATKGTVLNADISMLENCGTTVTEHKQGSQTDSWQDERVSGAKPITVGEWVSSFWRELMALFNHWLYCFQGFIRRAHLCFCLWTSAASVAPLMSQCPPVFNMESELLL